MTQPHQFQDWSVSLVVAAPADVSSEDIGPLADSVLQLLADIEVPDTVVSEDDGDLALSFTVRADGPNRAVDRGVDLWSKIAAETGIDSWPLVRAEAATYDELEKDFRATALPPLVGVSEVAEMLGVTKQRVSALHQENRLPRPLARLASGPVWAAAGIQKFSETRANRPYRSPEPASAAAPEPASAAAPEPAW
jgi:hypothetical protein